MFNVEILSLFAGYWGQTQPMSIGIKIVCMIVFNISVNSADIAFDCSIVYTLDIKWREIRGSCDFECRYLISKVGCHVCNGASQMFEHLLRIRKRTRRQ